MIVKTAETGFYGSGGEDVMIIVSRAQLKNFFDVLEVTESDVAESVAEGMLDETREHRNNAVRDYHILKGEIKKVVYE